MEHRWGQRVQVDWSVSLVCEPHGAGTGRIRNLSISGALVTTSLHLRRLERVEVILAWPIWQNSDGSRQSIRLGGYVVRRHGHDVGIEWSEATSSAVAALLREAAPCVVPTQAVLTIAASGFNG